MRQSLIRSAIAKLMEGNKSRSEPRSKPELKALTGAEGPDKQEPGCKMTFTYRHDNRSFTGEIRCIGPAIQVSAFDGEFYASLMVGYMQSSNSTAVISTWEVDGPAKCEQLTGTNADWDRYWQAFLAVLPKGLAEVVASFEDSVRY